MKFYELWFYYWGDGDDRNDPSREFVYYIISRNNLNTREEIIDHLKRTVPTISYYYQDKLDCIHLEHYPHLSKFFEISAMDLYLGEEAKWS